MLHKSILPIILLLTLCSCVVSFGMDVNNEKEVENKGNISNSIPVDINTTNTYPENVPTTSVNGFYWEKFNKNHKTICALYYYIFRVLSFCNLIATRTSPKNKYSYIIPYSLIRGIFSTKPFSSKYDFIGCNWYLGIGNVQYVGGFLTLAFVCKPTKYLPTFLQDKVTIHIIDFKTLYLLLTKFFNYYFQDFYYDKMNNYVSPELLPLFWLGFFVIEISINNYYNISINILSNFLYLVAQYYIIQWKDKNIITNMLYKKFLGGNMSIEYCDKKTLLLQH